MMKLPLTVEDCDLLDADNIHIGNTWEEGDAARIVAAVNHADALADFGRMAIDALNELIELLHNIQDTGLAGPDFDGEISLQTSTAGATIEHLRNTIAAFHAAKEAQP